MSKIPTQSRFKTDICEHYLKNECRFQKSQCRYAHGVDDLRCPYEKGIVVTGYDIHYYRSKKAFEDLFECDLKSTEIHKTFAFVFFNYTEDIESALKYDGLIYKENGKEYTLKVFEPPLNKQ